MTRLLIAGCVLAFLNAANATAAEATSEQPYAAIQSREIKALSEKEIAELKAGQGMGFALAAELNGYPGPRHVLDLADDLVLTDEQRTKTQALFDRMQSEAVSRGAELIAREMALDHVFAMETAQPDAVSEATAAVAEIRGKLRATHLNTHIAMAAILSDDQIRTYGELRGYTVAPVPGKGHDGDGHNGMHAH